MPIPQTNVNTRRQINIQLNGSEDKKSYDDA